jgi:hypothetical protein
MNSLKVRQINLAICKDFSAGSSRELSVFSFYSGVFFPFGEKLINLSTISLKKILH